MKKSVIALTLAASVAFMAAGCTQESSAPAPAAAPEAAAPALAEGTPPNVGVVSEALEGDSKSYVLMVNGENSYWIAAPQIALNVGESIAISAPIEKTDYKSEELGRTFERIFFVDTLMPKTSMGGGAAAEGSDPHAGVDMSQGQDGMPKAAPPADVSLEGIEKVEGGQTVADLFNKRDELVGKEVSFRGKVVKFSRGIMGSNWAHVRDGTGEAGTNDITVTTQDNADVGDTVVVSGIVEKDIDIGSGYFFSVILQNAKITKE
jgi:hypothetical protein